jgi:hypothetical protein
MALAFGLCFVGLRTLWVTWNWGCTLHRMDFPSPGTSGTRSLRKPPNTIILYERDFRANKSFLNLSFSPLSKGALPREALSDMH